MTLLDRLRALRLIVISGKGGVGKSTLTATLGRILARGGSHVLLLETDPRESLYQLLDVPPSGGEIQRAAQRTWVQNLRPREEIDRLVAERLRIRFLAQRVIASPVYQQFAETAPGLKELAVLGHALRLIREVEPGGRARFDTVLLDAPATGHSLSLLAGPGLVAEVIAEGPIGELAAELAGFVADTERCGLVVVTQAEEMPVRETVEMLEALRTRLDRRPEAIVVNGLYPSLPPGRGGGIDDPLALWRRRRAVNDEELARLSRHWSGPRVELPLVARDRGPGLVDALADELEAALAGCEVRERVDA